MKLTAEERNSSTWLKVKEYCEERLSSLRTRLETDLDEVKTAKARGGIAELKVLLAADKDQPPTIGSDSL